MTSKQIFLQYNVSFIDFPFKYRSLSIKYKQYFYRNFVFA